jgi:hypothetical protein
MRGGRDNNMRGYDQWKTANPPEYDYDCVEEAEKAIKDIKWALMNWEEKPPEGWDQHIDRLILHVEELINYIEENV